DAGIKTLTVGNMSNLLFSDGGYRGAVITTKEMANITTSSGKVVADAGASLSALADFCRNASLSGAEFLYGIPGTVGGGVYMNAGAFGGSVSDVLTASEYIKDGKFIKLDSAAHGFGYRNSVYKTSGGVIVSAEFSLPEGDRGEITGKMEGYLAKRRASQPLDKPSAGSVFKRPEGFFAGKLIEDAGLKGARVGGAAVSEKHAGFIVNVGGATAEDVKELIQIIKSRVFDSFGVSLEEEIEYVEP
ncbi:MAG: UDP-N-acetylmuramate dehydrogenase, partial [Clostridia bacterium]|nr:UDP-N-acetylmuramate dehydrogenase [Clostridia bacterium]